LRQMRISSKISHFIVCPEAGIIPVSPHINKNYRRKI